MYIWGGNNAFLEMFPFQAIHCAPERSCSIVPTCGCGGEQKLAYGHPTIGNPRVDHDVILWLW